MWHKLTNFYILCIYYFDLFRCFAIFFSINFYVSYLAIIYIIFLLLNDQYATLVSNRNIKNNNKNVPKSENLRILSRIWESTTWDLKIENLRIKIGNVLEKSQTKIEKIWKKKEIKIQIWKQNGKYKYWKVGNINLKIIYFWKSLKILEIVENPL